MPPKQTLRVVLLAYDDMNLLDLSGPLQALVTASKRHSGNGPALYETIVASADGGLITTSAGLPVMTVAIATLEGLSIDTLIAVGGCKGQEYYSPPALVDWIVRQTPKVRRLCSVCTGAFLLAATGQLDGKRVATHWEWVERLHKLHPAIDIDADKIFIKRTGGQSQFSVPLAAQAQQGGRFDELHAWVATNLRETLTVERLAEQAGMTPRTFARSYAAQLGRTPARMVEAMRLEAACSVVQSLY